MHTEDTENTFLSYPELSALSHPRRIFRFSRSSLPKALSFRSHAKPSNVQLARGYAATLVVLTVVCIAPVFGLLSDSLSLPFSLRALTITLSHRRPEQKGKSMKEKYDASARKSAFMLASWSTVPRFSL